MPRFLSGFLPAVVAASLALVGGVWADAALGPGRWSAATGDIISSIGVKMQARAANNAELNAYRWGGVIRRDGFAAAGDGGLADYTHSASACTLNGGAGDGGAQIPSGTGGCWNVDLSKPISAAVWGVKSDCSADDQPAWDKAVKALGALNGGGTLTMPIRKTCSKLNSTLSIQSSSVKILGSGPDATFFGVNFATGNGIEVGGNPASSTYTKNVTLQNLAVNALVSRTAGANIAVYRAINTHLQGVRCVGPYWICRATDGTLNGQEDTLDTGDAFVTAGTGQIGFCLGCLYAKASTLTAAVASGGTAIPVASTAGMYVGQYVSTPAGPNGAPGALSNSPITAISGNTLTVANGAASAIASGTAVNVIVRTAIGSVIDHVELTNHNGPAVQLQNVGGLFMTAVNTDFNYYGLLITPGQGQSVSGVFSDKSNWDASGQYGVLGITNAGGLIYANKFTDTWIASCGSPITQGIVPGTSPASCLRLTGPANTIFENTFDAHIAVAGQHCVELDGSVRDLTLSGNLTACSFQQPGPFQGIYSNGATHWSWNGTIGTTSNVPGVYPQAQQYSVYLTGATDYVRISGDIGRSASGTAIFNNASGTNFDYSAVLPALPWIATTPTMTCSSGALSTAGQSATMRYQPVGKTVNLTTTLIAGTNGGCSGLNFTLPFAAQAETVFAGRERSGSASVMATVAPGSSTATTTFYNSNATGANGSSYTYSGTYERQ